MKLARTLLVALLLANAACVGHGHKPQKPDTVIVCHDKYGTGPVECVRITRDELEDFKRSLPRPY